MNDQRLSQCMRITLLVSLMLALFGGYSTLAQGSGLNLRVTKVSKKSIQLRWDSVGQYVNYTVRYRRANSGSSAYSGAGRTESNSFTLDGLLRNATYEIKVTSERHSDTVTASTLNGTTGLARYTQPPATCRDLPETVVVTGYAENTFCQMVDDGAIAGQPDLQARGFINAVDVWNYVNGGLEVCFTYHGWMVFLDAAYAPRMVMELEHTHRDGLSCGIIDRPGTVIMLAEGPAASSHETHQQTQPDTQAEVESLPIFEAIPLADCQIKLVETLYLRSTPGGEIIGLVWLNSEVPAFEIKGYWYKIEFEGVTGYISRYHRKVLRGGCG